MHEVVRFHQLPPLWYTRQMHDDLSFDHVGLGAAAALRTLIDQRDAYRVRVQQLEQAATAPTVQMLLADPDVNAGAAYIRFDAGHGVELLGVSPRWGARWVAAEADLRQPLNFDPSPWQPTQAELRARGEVVPTSAYRT